MTTTALTCATCNASDASPKIRVRDLSFDPPAEYFFCCIFCRNVFLNANKGHIKTDRDYGDTRAIKSGM